jgi:hypothetical protein
MMQLDGNMGECLADVGVVRKTLGFSNRAYLVVVMIDSIDIPRTSPRYQMCAVRADFEVFI